MNAFNNLKVGNKIIIGYIAILVLMGSMATVLLFSLSNLMTDFTFLVEHDQPVLSNAHLLTKLAVDMETGERGFLITGLDEFLEPYHNGIAEFDRLLETEKKLVSDNPSQVAVLEKIGNLHDEWVRVAGKPEIAKRREANKTTVSAEHLQEILKVGVGKGILNELRGVLDQMAANLTAKDDLKSVILALKIAKNRLDQETGQRGFLITGEDSFLEPYHNGQIQLTTHIAALRARLAGDLDNRVLLDRVESLSAKWMEKAAEPEINARRKMNANPVTMADVSALIETGTGKDILDAMRTQFDTFIQNEHELNAERSKEAKEDVVQVQILTLSLTLGTILIGFMLGISISRGITRPLAKLTEMANQMAVGNLNQRVEVNSRSAMTKLTLRQDEMGDIGRAFEALARYFQEVIEDIVQVTQGLADGHLHPQSKTEYRGDFIQIKEALETATSRLAEATTKNTTQDWLKTGQAQLNDLVSGEQEIVKLAKNVISFLTTYTEAQVGLFYLLTESHSLNSKASLKLIASYAYTASDHRPTAFLVGEGLIGQAALERKQISVNRRPEECVHVIQSGLADVLPNHVLLIPFLYENTVKGLIEIGSSEALTEIKQVFFQQVMPNIGIAVSTTESRTRMQELLEQSQQQTEELQSQSEELQSQQEEMQQINEELQAQREELETKQVELQQRNEALQSQAEETKSQSEELQTQQEELRQSNEELEERTRELERQKSEIQHKNLALERTQAAIEIKAKELELASQYKSEFLANMSHELRTPLNSLLILAQLLANNKPGNLTDKQVEYARTIHSAGYDLLTLINDILDLSKVEAGKMDVNVEELPLTEWVETIEQKFRHLASEKGLAFHIRVAEDVPQILKTDVQRLQQIINNLLSNAFKFTEEGEINLTMQRPADNEEVAIMDFDPAKTLAFSVADTGIGIPEDKKQLIFEAFQQVDGSTSRHYGGTGLGLSISRQLARLLGGEIRLHSEEGKGSTFTLYLLETLEISNSEDQPPPTSVPSQADETVTATTAPETAASEVVENQITDDREALQPEDKKIILIIEDDRKFSDILMELAHEKDFKCLVAEEGKTGLQLAEQYHPNAIILDVGLPQMDGWTVMEQLKDNPDTRHIPVHFISASEQSVEAKKMGAIGYLHKPVNMEQLGEAFQKIEQFIAKTVKNLLIVVDNEPHQQKILDLVGSGDIQITLAVTTTEALQHLKKTAFDCIILGMDIEQGSGIKLVEQMQQKEGLCQTPLIVYADRELTSSEEALLLQCADHLPVKAVSSPERLLDEATLFLHQLETNLPKEKRNMLRMVHDKEAILANKKVLIVDDDARNTFALATVLEEKNLEIIAGNTGNEALELLDKHPDIALVLMDIMMPEMDGYEAMRQIRTQERFRKLPIIALTAKAMKGDKAKCIEAGANDYLSKPVDSDKLISLMRVWLYR